MANSKGIFIAGLFLSAIGISLFVISFALLPKVLREATNNAIIDSVIVDSPTSSSYNQWVGQKSVDNYFKQDYYLWNLTNPNEVLNGNKANYESIGPFNYKYEWEYSNITFSDNGNLATFIQRKQYTWVEGGDGALNPFEIKTTNFNPAYMGLLSKLSENSVSLGMPAEELLFILASAPQTNLFIEYFSNDNFTDIVYFFNGPLIFMEKYQQLLKSINSSMLVGSDDEISDKTYFIEQWCNSTSIPTLGNSSLWNEMLISYGLDSPSGISLDSAEKLLNLTNQYSFLNIDGGGGIVLWIQALMNGPDSESFLLLSNELGLDESQIKLIGYWWLNGFNPKFSLPLILEQCNIETIEYLGLCQFVTTIPLGYKSISSFDIPYLPWSQPIEIPIAMGANLSISTIQAKNNLFNNASTTSLLTVQGLGNFASQMSTSNFTAWNLTIDDAYTLIGYFTNYIPSTTGYSTQSVQSLYSTAGLIVTRSVDEWLWNCNDDLLNFLGIFDQSCSLQQNNTINKPSTIYTGKKDLSKTNQYQSYQEQTILSSAWPNGNVSVEGYTETGQMAPLQGVPDSITIFEENVLRPIQMIHSGSSSLMGVSTQRYYLMNDSFPVNPVFNNSIDGFANLSGIFNGAPVYVSLWDMFGVSTIYSTANINGLNQTYENSLVSLDLEPISGNTLSFDTKLQVNLQIPANPNQVWFSSSTGNWSNIYNNNATTNDPVFYPSLKVGQTATASSSQTNLLKQQFKQIQTVKIAPVVVVSIFGGILLISGLIMSIYGFKKSFRNNNNYDGYHSIN